MYIGLAALIRRNANKRHTYVLWCLAANVPWKFSVQSILLVLKASNLIELRDEYKYLACLPSLKCASEYLSLRFLLSLH